MKKSYLIMLGCLLGLSAFGQWTEPELLPPPINVDPPGDYYYCSISADGQVLCLTINPGIFGDDDVYISERTDSGWTVPVNAGPNVNTAQRNLSPSITNDRQRLYWVSWDGDYRFYTTTRTGPDWDDWSPGVPLPEPINRGWQFSGQISYDDSTLVFTSQGQPGPMQGDDAMYTSRLRPNGSWSEPVLCGFHLNRPNGSIHPCLTDSGRTLVYGQFGGVHFDIFYTFRNDTGFGPAMRCDSTINTIYWDSGPSCPADGSLLYFETRAPVGGDSAIHAKLMVARRVPSAVQEQPTRPHHHSENIQIVPGAGSVRSSFRITVPLRLRGQPIHIYNILGEQVDTLVPTDASQTQYHWKGQAHGLHNLSSGVYFLVTGETQVTAVGKVILLD